MASVIAICGCQRSGTTLAAQCMRHEEVLRGVGPGGTSRKRPIDGRSIGKWGTNLTAEQSDEIWDVVGDFMEEIGYRR